MMDWRGIFRRLLHRTPKNLEVHNLSHSSNLLQSQGQKLAREDVMRLIKENGGSEGLDLSGYDLSGANLRQLDLQGIVFGCLEIARFSGAESARRGANLEGARLQGSNLRRANFGRANLRGAGFYKADLREATLWNSNAEEANFYEADLSYASLRSTILRNARLDGAKLQGVDLYRADLRGATFSAESISRQIIQESLENFKQYFSRWYILPEVREKLQRKHIEERHEQAAEIYLALKNVFLNAGRYDDASWAYFKERQMRRITFAPWRARRFYSNESPESRIWTWQWWRFHLKYTMKWLVDWVSEVSCGYGERPLRTLVSAAIILLVFPFLFRLSGGVIDSDRVMTWLDYFNYSLGTFTTIGFSQYQTMTPLAQTLTSLEALLGISMLALLMFTLGKRISR